jgi:hypothetical protein
MLARCTAALGALVALGGCGGRTGPYDVGNGDALADTGGAVGTTDATTDSPGVEGSAETSMGDESGAVDASIDTTSDSAVADAPPEADARACVPATCASLGYECGPAADGCGGLLSCGTCQAPLCCGSLHFDRCAADICVPGTCAQENVACGLAGDGCGGLLDCGACPPPQACGASGVFGQCGLSDAAICAPETCAEQGIDCGVAGDGCGDELMCGTCTPPQTCGGAGVRGQCGVGVPDAGQTCCVPTTCAAQNIDCGPAGDGCGGLLQCGTQSACAPPQTCGGGGFGRCG